MTWQNMKGVPNELVGEVLSIFGKGGPIVDFRFKRAQKKQREGCVSAELLEEWNSTEVAKLCDDLPNAAKVLTRGGFPFAKAWVSGFQNANETMNGKSPKI